MTDRSRTHRSAAVQEGPARVFNSEADAGRGALAESRRSTP